MKLLEKSQINIAKVKETAREQSEGFKLARRVDSLREIAAQEEASLKAFRDKTLKQIQEDIQKESGPLEAIRSEVKELETARQKSLLPITKEKEEISKARAEMFKENEILNKRAEELLIKESQVARNLKEAEDEYGRAEEFQKRHARFLEDANVAKISAEGFLKNAVEIKSKSSKLAKEMADDLAKRDMEMAAKERSLKLREQSLDKKERELELFNIKLQDERGTLERAFARLKKKYANG